MDTPNSNIRRIDELGRIVIPKDIRRKLRIKENEPLEIYIVGEEIIIKKYSALPDIIDYLKYLVDIGNRITCNKYIVTNRTNVLAATNKSFENQNISQIMESYCLTGNEIKNEKHNLSITQSDTIDAYINLIPILIDGDRCGILLEYNEEKSVENETAIKIFKNLIEKTLSNS